MADEKPYRFLTDEHIEVERLDRGLHHWISRPGLTEAENLLVVRVEVEPGNGHPFHHHPHQEEVLYLLEGRMEQWVEQEKTVLEAGESVHIPRGVVHASYNSSEEPMVFLAIISPAEAEPFMIEVDEEEPWRRLR